MLSPVHPPSWPERLTQTIPTLTQLFLGLPEEILGKMCKFEDNIYIRIDWLLLDQQIPSERQSRLGFLSPFVLHFLFVFAFLKKGPTQPWLL